MKADLENVKLIEYTPKQDFYNCITHAAGAVFGVIALILAVIKTSGKGTRFVLSAVIFCLSICFVYFASSIYHGLKPGEAKRKARMADHLAIPLLLAGTATPCALITLYRVSLRSCLIVFILAWFCAAFAVISKFFFFEKMKVVCYSVIFIGGAIMLLCAVPLLGEINKKAFLMLLSGSVSYTIGAIFCNLGIKRPWFHVPFHIFALLGTIIQYSVIYHYVF